MAKTCEHLICELAGGGCHLIIGNDYGLGGPIGSKTVPAETIDTARELIAGLDSEAIKAEIARRKLEGDIKKLIKIAESEKHACHQTQSMDAIRERSAQLLDKLATIKTIDDLDKPL